MPAQLSPGADVAEAGAPLAGLPAIDVANVAYRVRGRDGSSLEILAPIDFQVRAGEFVSLVGPSGSGKSTLLNIISGLLSPSEGSVRIFGEPLRGIGRRIGYMFQTDALLPWRSVLRNVQSGLELAGVPRGEAARRAVDMLAQLGLSGFEHHYPSELSGGMRQRVSLARTWVTNPDLLLMDEPFGALDSQTKLVIQGSFLSFWEQHRKTVVLVTHDIEEAIAMSDRVVVMSARPGRLKSEYTIDLPRPRSVVELRGEARFTSYWKRIWRDLELEADDAMQGRQP